MISSTFLILLFLTSAVFASSSSAFEVPELSLSSQEIAHRKSPSFFAAVLNSSKFQPGENNNNRKADTLGTVEENIARTVGSSCKQVPSSSVSCDLCCDGLCCENPDYWNQHEVANESKLDGDAQSWIPIRFAFVVPTSYTLSNLPSTASLKELLGKTNQAFARSNYRFLLNDTYTIQNDTVWNQCVTDPCYTSTDCGFLNILLPAVNADVDREIVVISCHDIYYLGEAQFAWGVPEYQYVQVQLAGMLGPVLVHELGHYFGLMHTFQGTCSSQGDWVSDTPFGQQAAYSCGEVKDSCSSLPGNDATRNYMNYGLQWGCGLEFTTGQIARAKAAGEYFRPTLIKNTRVLSASSNFDSSAPENVNYTATFNISNFTQAPGCSVTASSFEDCWCEIPELDPLNWCRTIAPDGKTYFSGNTLAPPTTSGDASAGKYSSSSVCILFIIIMTVMSYFFLL